MKKIFTVLGVVAVAAFANAQIVINEVYGGGGNSGSTYTHDFIELKNRGTASITLTGATLQYASASGTFNQYHTLPAITLAPGQTYLIQEGAGTGGTTAINADFIAPIPTNFGSGTNTNAGFAMQASNVKVALVSNGIQVNTPTDSNVLDFVGTGSASQWEGTAAATGMTNSNSVSRTNGVDTNNNVVDFTAGTPTPQNSTGSLAVSDFNKSKSNFVKNTFVKNEEITFGADVKDVKIYTLTGQVVKTASVKDGAALNVAELAKGNYIVTGTVNNQPVSQKILKD
ncbi:MAG: C-terminal target protein [Chryseobacterium sp.]|jgi:hypothetical protein|nr:C-terminal target protein [Chryseobacterium sp.]